MIWARFFDGFELKLYIVKWGFWELKITLLVLYQPKMQVQKRPWFKYFELMFLIIQDVHQLISTNGSLGSIHDS